MKHGRERLEVADDGLHHHGVGLGARAPRAPDEMYPAAQHRGERPVLVADDPDRARWRCRISGRRNEDRDAGVHEKLQGLRAEHHADAVPPPMRRHEDQVAAGVARRAPSMIAR